MFGFSFPQRRLVASGVAFALVLLVAAPASAQQPSKRFLDLDASGRPIWVYYLDKITRTSHLLTPKDLQGLSPADRAILQALKASRVANGWGRSGTGVSSGRHYSVGGNRTGTTKTQTWHVGERQTGARGGSSGRGRGR